MDVVTVVVPVYNVEHYLRECLESIINQTYQDLQIILVDDGSTDSSNIICDEYALRDKRVQVIHKDNRGLSDARNKGIDLANGEYITFIDSDDVIEQDMIEYLVQLISKYKADISVCQARYISDDGILLKKPCGEIKEKKVINVLNCIHEFLYSQEIGTVAWRKLYKRSLFQEIRYPVGRYHEDVFTTYKLVAISDSIAIGSEVKYLYRIRPSSIMQSSFSPKHLDLVAGKREMSRFIENKFPDSPDIIELAYASIIYAANKCVYRIGESNNKEGRYIKYLQYVYRKYEKYYLRCSESRLISKLFSISAYVNVRFVVQCVSLINKVRIKWSR